MTLPTGLVINCQTLELSDAKNITIEISGGMSCQKRTLMYDRRARLTGYIFYGNW